MTDYPPEPWDLEGHGYIGLWLVPTRVVPALPAGVRPVSVFGRTLVVTAFVDYLPGGLLPYRELLVAPVVRQGLRPAISITDIWVDSEASRAGGRELWGIPKEMAEFSLSHSPVSGSARVEGAVVASVEGRRGRRGVRPPFPVVAAIVQTLRGAVARTPLRADARIQLTRLRWRTDGPLAWLTPYRPFLTAAATDFRMRFGPRR